MIAASSVISEVQPSVAPPPQSATADANAEAAPNGERGDTAANYGRIGPLGKALAVFVLAYAVVVCLQPGLMIWQEMNEASEMDSALILRVSTRCVFAVVIAVAAVAVWTTASKASRFAAEPAERTERLFAAALTSLVRWGIVAIIAAGAERCIDFF